MSWRAIRNALVLALATALGAGCGTEDDDGMSAPAEQQAELSVGSRCTIRGEPAVTQGCTAAEVCIPYACTNSVPPSCLGTCRAQPKLPKRSSCDVTGDPPLTTGCQDGERCVLEACTDSIPPHCFGHCAP